MSILRKFTVLLLAVSLCLTTVACGNGNQNASTNNVANQTAANTKLADGQYPVQQASYDDGSGEYTLFLLNSKPPTFTTENLQMARLTDDQIKAGQKSYLKVDNGQPVLFLTEDFKIEYVHNVTENKTDPNTGRQETVVIRQENSFWAPFAGALAGQALGSLLFRPQYYVPPVYQPGGVIRGFGGYGSTYDQAVSSYRTRYNSEPAAVRNRTAFRTTGNIRRSSGDSTLRSTNRTRPSGSGVGTNTLKSSGNSSNRPTPSNNSFGSGRSSRRTSSFRRRR